VNIDLRNYDAVTFDCYGTLIDWDTGISNDLGPLAVQHELPGKIADLVESFAKFQYENQRIRPFKNYREVIRDSLEEAVSLVDVSIPARDLDAFAKSVGTWPAFADTVDSLRVLKSYGLHLGVLSNVDRLSFEQSHERLGCLIDTVVTADMAQAYKPDLEMFNALFQALEEKGISRDRVLHLAQSRFHDVAPGNEIGLDVVWIDRRHGRPGKGVTISVDAAPVARFANLEEFCSSSLC